MAKMMGTLLHTTTAHFPHQPFTHQPFPHLLRVPPVGPDALVSLTTSLPGLRTPCEQNGVCLQMPLDGFQPHASNEHSTISQRQIGKERSWKKEREQGGRGKQGTGKF